MCFCYLSLSGGVNKKGGIFAAKRGRESAV